MKEKQDNQYKLLLGHLLTYPNRVLPALASAPLSFLTPHPARARFSLYVSEKGTPFHFIKDQIKPVECQPDYSSAWHKLRPVFKEASGRHKADQPAVLPPQGPNWK